MLAISALMVQVPEVIHSFLQKWSFEVAGARTCKSKETLDHSWHPFLSRKDEESPFIDLITIQVVRRRLRKFRWVQGAGSEVPSRLLRSVIVRFLSDMWAKT